MMKPNDEPEDLGQFDGHDIYPMPMFVTLAVADVEAVADWYAQALGFKTIFKAPDGKSLVHLRRRKYQDLLITRAPSEDAPRHGPSSMTLSLSADGEIDALAERARAAPPLGHSKIVGPVDTPWNTRDLRVTDPAGYHLVFTGRNPSPDPEQAARMKAMFDRARASRG